MQSKQDIKRELGTVVDLGSGCGHIAKHATKDMMKKLIMCDMSGKKKKGKLVEYSNSHDLLVKQKSHYTEIKTSIMKVFRSGRKLCLKTEI